MIIFRLPISILLAAFLCAAGCTITTPNPITPNPLAGWVFRQFDDFAPPSNRHHYHLDKAITDDYQNFISENHLYTIGAITGFFEDGNGERAVEFEGYKDHSSWHYVLKYDNNNKRIKVIKYGYSRYMS